jgi:hypothetical protein
MMLMALSLALLLLLAAADRPDVASTVVAGLPSIFDAHMCLIAIVTCNPVHASVLAVLSPLSTLLLAGNPAIAGFSRC